MTDMPGWNPISTAKRDGTMYVLLCEKGEHATEDDLVWRTIGFNNEENDGDPCWRAAGWCWSHDHFTAAHGFSVLGWKELPAL